MSIKDVLKIENNTERDMNVIYLIKDGEGSPWYRAYNWSAYLLEFFPNNLNESNRLKATKRKIKSEKVIIISVGLQAASFNKYMPGSLIDNTDPNIVKITINPKDYENYPTKENYDDWLDSIELSENKRELDISKTASAKQSSIYSRPTTFCSIMKKIIGFDIRNKNEEELADFIQQLKQDCANLI